MISSLLSVLLALDAAGWGLLGQAAKAKAGSGQSTAYMIQLGIWGGLLLLLLVIAYVVVRSLRESATGSGSGGSDVLSNFQEMRQEGDISDAEFRNIKAVVGNQLGGDVRRRKDTA